LEQIKWRWICVEINVAFTSMWVVFGGQCENNFQHVFLGHRIFGIFLKIKEVLTSWLQILNEELYDQSECKKSYVWT
jgi:hypothetical protein